jgi:hypothetical protein
MGAEMERRRRCAGPVVRRGGGSCTLAAMVWATRRGLALALLCAPACARGVSLEGSGAGETLGTTGMVMTDVAPPTGTPADTTDPATTLEEASTTTTTTGDAPTDGTEESSTGDDPTTTGPELPHPELYPYDRVHSPITAFVADRLRAIAPVMANVDTTFAKIGGTTTASANFMKCLATETDILELPPELSATKDFFNVELEPGVTSYTRDSTAALMAVNSTMLKDLVGGEVAMITPRFAHVLVGTHDLASDQPVTLYAYADNLLDIVDELLAGGVVPILSTLPLRTDMPAKSEFIPSYNGVIRAAAQGRQIPLVDLELALRSVPMSGLGPDGIDLSSFISAMEDRPCFFNEAGLTGGYNVRNRESLVALDRARRAVVLAEPELDAPQAGLRGSGTLDDPYLITSLPFVDLRSTADSASDLLDMYGGACDGTKDESGPEVVYRLEIEAPVELRMMTFDRGTVDVDPHVLSDADPGTCLKRNDKEITGPLPNGDYTVVVDSYAGDVPGGAAGEYMLVVLAD